MFKKNRLIKYLERHHVLSLCVTDELDFWCANCFYVFNEKDMVFWLMTDLETRHTQIMLKNHSVVGTINDQSKNVMLIKGVQYKGNIILLKGKQEYKASCFYKKRFPLIKYIRKAPLWEIVLEEIKMTDNTLGFGKKIIWYRKE